MKTATVETANVQIELDVTAYVKWEERAKTEKKTVGECLGIFLAKTGTTNPQ